MVATSGLIIGIGIGVAVTLSAVVFIRDFLFGNTQTNSQPQMTSYDVQRDGSGRIKSVEMLEGVG